MAGKKTIYLITEGDYWKHDINLKYKQPIKFSLIFGSLYILALLKYYGKCKLLLWLYVKWLIIN